MENQINESKPVNVKGLVLLIGVVFGAFVSYAANGTFASIIGGLVGGLILAVFFNSVILPQKPHDR